MNDSNPRPPTGQHPDAATMILAAIAETGGCLLARMSGSGATCFGLFADAQAAARASRRIAAAQPDWWVVATRLSGQPTHEQCTGDQRTGDK